MATLNRLPAGIAWEKPADLSSKDVLKRLSPPAVKAFLKIRELWELRDEDARRVLGGGKRSRRVVERKRHTGHGSARGHHAVD